MLLWAAVRSGKTLPEAFFKDDRWKPSRSSVLDGMVHVCLLERPAEHPEHIGYRCRQDQRAACSCYIKVTAFSTLIS